MKNPKDSSALKNSSKINSTSQNAILLTIKVSLRHKDQET